MHPEGIMMPESAPSMSHICCAGRLACQLELREEGYWKAAAVACAVQCCIPPVDVQISGMLIISSQAALVYLFYDCSVPDSDVFVQCLIRPKGRTRIICCVSFG